MAIYGRGQMLGSGINPESFKQDYSGFANAAAMQAQGIANLGQSIGGAIQDYGKIKKQQQEDERAVQKSKSVAKAIGDLIPDLKPTLENSLMLLDDKELPLSQRKAEADAISDILTLGIGAISNKQKLDLERSQIEAATNEAKARAANKPMTLAEIAMGGGKQQVMLDPITGIAKPITMQGFEGQPQQTSPLSNLPQPLQPYAKTFEEAGARHGVPPALLAAISMQETGNGTSSAFRNKNNAMGISDRSGPIAMPSVEASIEKMANLLGKGINEGTGPYAGVKSIEDIGRIYAPAGAVNDPRNLNPGWSQGVTSQFQKLMQAQQPAASPAQGRVGFTPDKIEKTETFRPATAEESAMYGGMPGQMSSTGKFIPINLPSGFSIEQTPEGGLTVVQGAGVGGKQAAQKAAAEAYKMKNATALSQELNRLEDTTQDMAPGVVGSVARMAGERIPGTDLAARKATIDRVVSTLTLQNLQDMRNSSPTGASLGSISNMDVGLLRDSATALSNAQSPEAFQRELTRLQNLQHEIIYGKESVLRDKLSKKEITQTQFDEAMAAAPKRFIDERGQIQFRNTAAPSETGVGLTPEANANLDALGIPRQSTN